MDELVNVLFRARGEALHPSPPNLSEYTAPPPPEQNPPQTFEPEDMTLKRSKRTIDKMLEDEEGYI